MKGPEIRQSYLDFFAKYDHLIVDSASVVPHDDPTLMFTNAGMNQFKPYFLGQATPERRRIADTQKCIRVSGKHNDLEETGVDTYHHTFFEMLGNWSFGDYYKKEAIEWAWELLTKVWGLPKERLYATVFGGDEEKGLPADEEAEKLWASVTNIDPSHILRFGAKDNFWMMGETGPCGPCSEIHIDLTPDMSGGPLVNQGSPLAMEIWNLVFIQFNAESDGSLRELPAKHVDTGMGFERVCAVVECTDGGKDFTRPISNYDTEVFRPLLDEIRSLSGRTYTPGQSSDIDSIAMRVIADHIRMVSFAIADGALPGADGRGFVVRRLLRRAARYGRKLGLTEPFMWKLVSVLETSMGKVFPELTRERAKLEKVIRQEEERFNETLDRGIGHFEEVVTTLSSGATFPGEAAFKLHDTYGFPLDLTQLMARERGFEVDEDGFKTHMDSQKERARAAQVKHVVHAAAEELELHPTPFVGFDELEAETSVEHVLPAEKYSDVVLARTPFYGEMGGQVGDTGWLHLDEGEPVKVISTARKEGVFYHRVEGTVPAGAEVRAEVDRDRRLAIERHHTATHILHWALREVLGKDVRQQGSLVAPDRLRFDFTHGEGVQPAQLRTIERMINEHVFYNDGVSWFEIPYKDKPESVVAFFGDKYGELVRVVKIGGSPGITFDGYSMELCGGTHTRRTGELGPFRFLSEGAIAAGIRRVEAVCGQPALDSIAADLEVIERLSRKLGVPSAQLEARLESMLEGQKALERQLDQARRAEAVLEAGRLLEVQTKVGEVPVLASNVGAHGGDFLRLVADALRPKFQGVAVLAGTDGEKVALLAMVDKGLVKQGYHAGNLIRELAKKVGGGGGGRPDLAEAGGKNPAALGAALQEVPQLVKAQGKG